MFKIVVCVTVTREVKYIEENTTTRTKEKRKNQHCVSTMNVIK